MSLWRRACSLFTLQLFYIISTQYNQTLGYFGHRIGVEYLRLEHTNLTLSNTKRGTNLGALVVPFDQTCHPLDAYIVTSRKPVFAGGLSNAKAWSYYYCILFLWLRLKRTPFFIWGLMHFCISRPLSFLVTGRDKGGRIKNTKGIQIPDAKLSDL